MTEKVCDVPLESQHVYGSRDRDTWYMYVEEFVRHKTQDGPEGVRGPEREQV